MLGELLLNIFRFVGIILFYTWPLFVIFIAYLVYKNAKIRKHVSNVKHTLLKIQVPKDNEKSPLAAELMFASLHGIYQNPKETGGWQEHISFEIVSQNNKIYFYVWVPENVKDFVEGQIYAQYPTAEIKEASDYTEIASEEQNKLIGAELELDKPDIYPIKTFLNFEVDTLAGITATLSKLENKGEKVWIQMIIRPADDSWQNNALNYIEGVKGGKITSSAKYVNGFFNVVGTFMSAIFNPDGIAESNGKVEPPRLSSAQEASLKSIEEKASKLGFETKIRICFFANDPSLGKQKMHGIVGAFKQFTTILNGFKSSKMKTGKEIYDEYRARYFGNKGSILNIEELASIFHLPNITVETPTIQWTKSKKGEQPDNLPIVGSMPDKDLTVFAETNFRHMVQKFGITNEDRNRHMYVIGKTGVGKSNMLENMAIADMNAGDGIAVIDPHGDFIDKILNYIPKDRMDDVIILNPEDRDFPIAFNPLETVNPDHKGLVASGLISIFQKIWAFTWGPRLEHILRNTILALLDYPDSTMLGVTRMLEDKNFRKKVVKRISDPVVKNFWLREFAEYNEKFRTEAIAPIQNKVGQFLSSATVRNIIGQPKSTIDFREIMDSGKIILVKLAQGAIGEDNSSLLGAMIITKIQLAAMSRVDIPEEKRKNFYLYVDEFQNFATESFAKILSEARKYKLNLTVANQYIAQMPETVRDAVFGNVGTIVAFRVGANDAPVLAKELAPVFDETDIVNLDKYNIYIKMAIDGVTSPAFSAYTLPLPEETPDLQANKDKVIALSREKYANSRESVEQNIAKWAGVGTDEEATGDMPVMKTITKDYKKYAPKPNPGPNPNQNQVNVQKTQHQAYQHNTDEKIKGSEIVSEALNELTKNEPKDNNSDTNTQNEYKNASKGPEMTQNNRELDSFRKRIEESRKDKTTVSNKEIVMEDKKTKLDKDDTKEIKQGETYDIAE